MTTKTIPIHECTHADRIIISLPGSAILTEERDFEKFDWARGKNVPALTMTLVIKNFENYTIWGEREIPDVPTRNGALLYPHDTEIHTMVFLDEYGQWRSSTGMDYNIDEIAAMLEDETHYIAFEGIE